MAGTMHTMTQCHIPENLSLQQLNCGNLKCQIAWMYFYIPFIFSFLFGTSR